MTDRHVVGKALTKASLQIIKQCKKIIIFPIFNAILTIATLLLILIPLEKLETTLLNQQPVTPIHYVIAFALIIFFFFVMHLLNTLTTAFVSIATYQVIKKDPPSLWQLISKTMQNGFRLFGWVMIVGHIGFAIKICETWMDNWYSTKMANRLLSRLPWLIGTLFSIPIIVLEKSGPMAAMQRSASLVTQQWGNVNKTRLITGPKVTALRLASFMPLIIGAYIAGVQGLQVGGSITVVLLFSTGVYATLTQMTTLCALYLYAIDDVDVTQFYNPEILKCAFYTAKKA